MLVVDGDGVVRDVGARVVRRAHRVRERGAARAHCTHRVHGAHCAHSRRADLLIISYHHSRRVWLTLCDIVLLSWSRFNSRPDFMFPLSSFWFDFDTFTISTVFCFSGCFARRGTFRPLCVRAPMRHQMAFTKELLRTDFTSEQLIGSVGIVLAVRSFMEE